MSERFDHAGEAAGQMFGWNALVNSQENWRELVVAESQVHATLALVEQQRIANIIAWTTGDGNEPDSRVKALIESGMGLA